jgi:hypothetical protein
MHAVLLFGRQQRNMTTTTTMYNGFRIKTRDNANANANELAHLKKTVDDYETECNQNQVPTQVDAARIAMSHRVACRMLKPMSADQHMWLKRVTLGLNVGPIDSALMPNRIEIRHVTRSSRVRNLVHGGILGLLARQFMHDTSQSKTRSCAFNALCIIRRVNNQAGCEHVKWSIPDFQCRYNIGVKYFKRSHNPFEKMNHDEMLVQLSQMDTLENRQIFMEKCKSVANAPNQSRVKYGVVADADADADAESKYWKFRPTVLNDDWITHFITVFSKLCSLKMSKVSDSSATKINRCMSLVEVFRFISSRMDWILTDPNLRQITKLHAFWDKYMGRISYMAAEGIEHSAYMVGRYFPEMMTPELHIVVNPVVDVYRVPEMQIADDDALFGPMKAKCEALLPAPMLAPMRVSSRDRIYSDSDDDYNNDYSNDYSDDCNDDYNDDYSDDYSDDDNV